MTKWILWLHEEPFGNSSKNSHWWTLSNNNNHNYAICLTYFVGIALTVQFRLAYWTTSPAQFSWFRLTPCTVEQWWKKTLRKSHCERDREGRVYKHLAQKRNRRRFILFLSLTRTGVCACVCILVRVDIPLLKALMGSALTVRWS